MKYHNRKIERNGMIFDSVKEYKRFVELSLLEKAGKITDLRRQVKYVLIPAQYEPDTESKRGEHRKGRLIERECAYYADFVYCNNEGRVVVEDTKGYRTPEYIIKRKLMLQVYGIRIREV